ncbi:hypothetical protein GCM10022198_12790 [Klugiella xanthotipulae]|uniref:Uncharacterized protein with FMN-binding domain n=1 Tax=Klugiella xanthotipulae TaxID=244735 RepID=A0A543I440_9MICO|nr:FMN-binding protein [Klugiella xanthotipulae]TQM65366.1 uncharacterized protein with FMN-binding domain [Klugiella xanthotipulae]
MRKRAVYASILSSAAVLAVGWQIGTMGTAQTSVVAATTASDPATTPPSTSGSNGATAEAPSDTTTTDTPTTPPDTTTTAPATAATDGTYTGASASTRFGNVQVQITVAGGQLTEVTALQLTDSDGKSVQISNRAAPVLREEALTAQSAAIQTVSGATYTSEAYITSLQSALDQAGL